MAFVTVFNPEADANDKMFTWTHYYSPEDPNWLQDLMEMKNIYGFLCSIDFVLNPFTRDNVWPLVPDMEFSFYDMPVGAADVIDLLTMIEHYTNDNTFSEKWDEIANDEETVLFIVKG
jgi:hypothetical protein